YGEGGVYRRRNQWWIRYWHSGKLFREPAGERRRDATDLLKARHGEAAQGRIVGPVAEKLTLADLLGMGEADHTLNARQTKAPTARLLEAFGDNFRALDLTHDELTRYAGKRLREGAQPATVRNELAVLGRGFTLAHRAGKLPQRPALPSIRVRNARS